MRLNNLLRDALAPRDTQAEHCSQVLRMIVTFLVIGHMSAKRLLCNEQA